MTTPALAFDIRGRGRHYRHPDHDEPFPSITNILGVLDKPALKYWSAKVVAEQAWTMRNSLDGMGREECVDVLKGAPWRNSGRAADRGSSIHDYLDCVANGRPVPDDLSDEAKTYLPAVEEFLGEFAPEWVHNEFTVFGDGYAGTGDFIATIRGQLVMGDFKTSKDLYPEIALQLAALRYAEEMVDGDNLVPIPEVDLCVGVLLTPKGCRVHEVDAGPEAYGAFRACLAAWEWQKGPKPIGAQWMAERKAA